MRLKTLIVVFNFILFKSIAQNDTPQLLAQKLSENLTSDSAKVAAIYRWVTDNINYDYHFRRREEGDTTLYQEPEQIIIRKKAVCIGYAKLIKRLCAENNIPSVIIEGYVKNANLRLETEEHAWNAVKINQNWYLLDATWGTDNSFAAKKYFFTDPSVFLENHYPHDPIWQLTDKPLTFECFAYNEDCLDFNFNLKDSLATWEQQDTLTRLFAEANRILAFNNKNLRAYRQAAEVFTQVATGYFLTYNKIREEVRAKKRQATGKAEVLILLENARQNLELAKLQYENVKKYARKNTYTDAHLNIDLINENLANLIIEKEFVEKNFKN